MSKNRLSLISIWLLMLTFQFGFSQDLTSLYSPVSAAYSATPKHMWELGLHTGGAYGFTDIKGKLGLGGGFHLRKAIDYVFSLRGDVHFKKFNFENTSDGKVETGSFQTELQLLVSLNNLNWGGNGKRKTNVFAFTGGGATHIKAEVKNSINPYLVDRNDWMTHGSVGFGMAFRVSERVNLGLETKVMMFFGKNADLHDGIDRRNNDVTSYTSVRLNFNLGNKSNRSEPLYWVNPLDVFMKDISELKARPVFDMTDTDGDGIIDILDQEVNTPANVAVDTRGIALDSDGDGIPNYQDEDPYVPSGTKYIKESERGFPTYDEVNDLIDKKLTGHLSSQENDAINWFFPIIHFNVDNYKVRFVDYGNLSNVAKVMKANSNMKIVVTGFTDKTASEYYNLVLSYKRALATIEHLVKVHGISRDRFILQYTGEESSLVPSLGSTIMNRRVEFRAAIAGDREMAKPEQRTSSKKN